MLKETLLRGNWDIEMDILLFLIGYVIYFVTGWYFAKRMNIPPHQARRVMTIIYGAIGIFLVFSYFVLETGASSIFY